MRPAKNSFVVLSVAMPVGKMITEGKQVLRAATFLAVLLGGVRAVGLSSPSQGSNAEGAVPEAGVMGAEVTNLVEGCLPGIQHTVGNAVFGGNGLLAGRNQTPLQERLRLIREGEGWLGVFHRAARPFREIKNPPRLRLLRRAEAWQVC